MGPIVHTQRCALPPGLTSLLRVRFGGVTVGLPVTAVREVVRAVSITPVPGAPVIVEGAVNIRGQLVAVIDVRGRLAIPPRALDPSEFFVVLVRAGRALAFRVDDVDDLVDVDTIEAAAELSPALRGLAGLAARPDGLLVIVDPDAFVSQAEMDALETAISESAA